LHEPEVVRVPVVAFVRGSIGELHRDREPVAILRADLSQQLEQLNAGNSRQPLGCVEEVMLSSRSFGVDERERNGMPDALCVDPPRLLHRRAPDSGKVEPARSLDPMIVNEISLRTGACMRVTGPASSVAGLVCLNGGRARAVEGTWSASLEWLVRRLAPKLPELRFAEVKYRIKSWRRLDLCVDDARAAIAELGAERTLLLGFSMGGAVAISAADAPGVEAVLGLAPWIPDRLSLTPLLGKRLDVLHGSLDRWLPGIPGVSPDGSRRGFERARALGVPGSYALIPGGLHGIAVRAHRGRPVPVPRARVWARRVAAQLDAFAG
jgi:pimeloyl-ACP methyl ester carboxylesterase